MPILNIPSVFLSLTIFSISGKMSIENEPIEIYDNDNDAATRVFDLVEMEKLQLEHDPDEGKNITRKCFPFRLKNTLCISF